MLILDPATARERVAAHERRVDAWVAGWRARQRVGARHPVEDFLFTYYSYRPARLRRWHPGLEVAVVDVDPATFGAFHAATAEGTTVDLPALLARRGETVAWIRRLLVATAGRAPQLGCFGLHEWAMVYRVPEVEVRHSAWPLRLSAAGTAAVVDTRSIRCSHYDAFRFFTSSARPLNVLQPTRANQVELEQPGCLHANMDVYRWAYKLAPLAGAELIADCFALARQIRELDMRASPYDLSELGFSPVRIETPEGRADYAVAQRDFAARAADLRSRLIALCDVALSAAPALPHDQ